MDKDTEKKGTTKVDPKDEQGSSKKKKDKKSFKKKQKKGSGSKNPNPNPNPEKEGESSGSRKPNSGRLPNDSSWYGGKLAIGKAAGNISTVFIYGTDDTTCFPIPTDAKERLHRSNIIYNGMIQTLGVDCTAGRSKKKGSFSTWGKCAVNFFNALRGDKTSTVPFEAIDVLITIIAEANVIALAGHIDRLFRAVQTTIPTTMMTPKILTDALAGRTDTATSVFSDLVQNKGLYWLQFNQILTELNALTMPGGLPIFDRARWLFSAVYADEDKLSGTNMYAYVPHRLFKYNPTKSEAGGGLDVIDVSNPKTMKELLDHLQDMIDALTNDDDVRQISAWILAQNPTKSYFTFEVFNESYIDPVNNDEVLEQMMNALPCYPSGVNFPGEGVTQENGDLINNDYDLKYYPDPTGWGTYQPGDNYYLSNALQEVLCLGTPILSYHDITSDDVLVYTRMMALREEVISGSHYTTLLPKLWAVSSVNIVARDPSQQHGYFISNLDYNIFDSEFFDVQEANIIKSFDYGLRRFILRTINKGSEETPNNYYEIGVCQSRSHIASYARQTAAMVDTVCLEGELGLFDLLANKKSNDILG